MSPLRLSVVVVSAGRPEALCRCLTGLSQMVMPEVEVVVVADPRGLAAIAALPFADRIKTAEQGHPNISVARNTGVTLASGEIVAFIDDDAVPEPTWGAALLNGFSDEGIAAVTGPVLGRNGISEQWGSMAVEATGWDIETDPDLPVRDGFARKLQGTNMAIRRSVLQQLGGFDPAFAFYLDDTDLAFRLGRAELASAYLQGAVVHHGYAESPRRTADRVPKSLHDIGASMAVYLRKHAPDDQHATARRRMEAEQSSRLLRLAKERKITAEEMHALMETLRDGWSEGQERVSGPSELTRSALPYQPLNQHPPPPPLAIGGWSHQARRFRARAAALVAQGQPVTLFLFEPSPRKHKLLFTDGGWWEQTGGLFGSSVRTQPRLRFWRLAARISEERRRISATRGLELAEDRFRNAA